MLKEVGRFAAFESTDANKLETEQEREQEQEQQKEVQARRDQQIEVEKFVDREYSRQEEAPQPWPISMLAVQPTTEDHPFYRQQHSKPNIPSPTHVSNTHTCTHVRMHAYACTHARTHARMYAHMPTHARMHART